MIKYFIRFLRFLTRNPNLWGNRFWTKEQLTISEIEVNRLRELLGG